MNKKGNLNKKTHQIYDGLIEALDGIEPPFDGLQSPAYPLDHNATLKPLCFFGGYIL